MNLSEPNIDSETGAGIQPGYIYIYMVYPRLNTMAWLLPNDLQVALYFNAMQIYCCNFHAFADREQTHML